MIDLPVRPTLGAFERGVSPARIATAYGVDVKDVVDFLVHHLRARGLTREEVVEMFAETWGLT